MKQSLIPHFLTFNTLRHLWYRVYQIYAYSSRIEANGFNVAVTNAMPACPSGSGPFSGINCSPLSELSYVISSNSTGLPTFVPQLDQEKTQTVNYKEVSGERKAFKSRLSQSMEDLKSISYTWSCKLYEPSRLVSNFSVSNFFTSIPNSSGNGLRDTSGFSTSQIRYKHFKRSSDPRYYSGTPRLGAIKRRPELRNSVNNSYVPSQPLAKMRLKRATIASRRQSFSSLSNGDANDSGCCYFTIPSVSGLMASSQNNNQTQTQLDCRMTSHR
ncbi:uncharacterized protein ACN427_004418 [Glossina fuscipes fuscipes]